MNSKRTTDEDEDGGENKLRAIIITTTTTAWRYGRNEGEFKLLMRKINRERRQGKGKGKAEKKKKKKKGWDHCSLALRDKEMTARARNKLTEHLLTIFWGEAFCVVVCS